MAAKKKVAKKKSSLKLKSTPGTRLVGAALKAIVKRRSRIIKQKGGASGR